MSPRPFQRQERIRCRLPLGSGGEERLALQGDQVGDERIFLHG